MTAGCVFIATIWLTVTSTVAVPGTLGQPPPDGAFVVIVKVTFPLLIDGVYVALTNIGLVPEVTIFEKVPLGADQVPEAAFPVNVPITDMEPLEQTFWEL